MRAKRETFLAEKGCTGNGYAIRYLDTALGHLRDLPVPHDREGRSRPQMWNPYQRCTPDLERLLEGCSCRA